MTREELKNMLYNRKYIAGGDYDNENPFVGTWLDDFVEITHEINNELIDKACEWLHTAIYLDYERSIEHRYETLEELLNDFKKAMKGGES